MGTITDTIDVNVDRTTAYNQWTQFEEFPMFMEGVKEVRQLGDSTLHWVTNVGPVVREYDAVITEQLPDEVIAWHSTSGPDTAGRVTFMSAGDNHTHITAEITLDPEGLVEKVGDMTGAIDARVAGDLKRFKEFIESRGGQETGAWRGTIGGEGGMTQGGLGDDVIDDGVAGDTLGDGTHDGDTLGGSRMGQDGLVDDRDTSLRSDTEDLGYSRGTARDGRSGLGLE
jgi:hypothetical protein